MLKTETNCDFCYADFKNHLNGNLEVGIQSSRPNLSLGFHVSIQECERLRRDFTIQKGEVVQPASNQALFSDCFTNRSPSFPLHVLAILQGSIRYHQIMFKPRSIPSFPKFNPRSPITQWIGSRENLQETNGFPLNQSKLHLAPFRMEKCPVFSHRFPHLFRWLLQRCRHLRDGKMRPDQAQPHTWRIRIDGRLMLMDPCYHGQWIHVTMDQCYWELTDPCYYFLLLCWLVFFVDGQCYHIAYIHTDPSWVMGHW